MKMVNGFPSNSTCAIVVPGFWMVATDVIEMQGEEISAASVTRFPEHVGEIERMLDEAGRIAARRRTMTQAAMHAEFQIVIDGMMVA